MIKMTMKKMTIVACWQVVHVVLDGDNDDFLNEDFDDIMMMINKARCPR